MAEGRDATGGGETLAELLSRDPEGYGEQDLVRVVEEMRKMRERLAVFRQKKGVKSAEDWGI